MGVAVHFCWQGWASPRRVIGDGGRRTEWIGKADVWRGMQLANSASRPTSLHQLHPSLPPAHGPSSPTRSLPPSLPHFSLFNLSLVTFLSFFFFLCRPSARLSNQQVCRAKVEFACSLLIISDSRSGARCWFVSVSVRVCVCVHER